MTEVEVAQEELDRLVEMVEASMTGGTSMRKKVSKMLQEHKGRIKTPQEIKRIWSKKIKGSMAEEIIRMREAE